MRYTSAEINDVFLPGLLGAGAFLVDDCENVQVDLEGSICAVVDGIV